MIVLALHEFCRVLKKNGFIILSFDYPLIKLDPFTAEHDPITPAWYAETVLKSIPLVTFRQIANAGHFSFLSPFPKSLRNPILLPSTDSGGFAREKFRVQLSKEILAYPNEKLSLNYI